MPFPTNPIAAVTHPDPYPYYAQLVAERPVYRDEELGAWVVASAEAVAVVLTSDLCRVRPAAEPVPKALRGSAAGEIFGRLVRMTDGERHRTTKPAVMEALGAVDVAEVERLSNEWSARLLDGQFDNVSDFAFALPVHVLGTLLGVPREMLEDVTIWTGEFARCIAPDAAPEQVARGKTAAGHLRDVFWNIVTGENHGQISTLDRQMHATGLDDHDLVVANAIGFLFQSFDATAGLIGNTLLALASGPVEYARAATDHDALRKVLLEVLRSDPPIQNTRRFVERDGTVAGVQMKTGDAIVVVLAAANRDLAAEPATELSGFSFGMGSHACPGAVLATTIARAGVQALLAAGLVPAARPATVVYRPSANARIPILTATRSAMRSATQ